MLPDKSIPSPLPSCLVSVPLVLPYFQSLTLRFALCLQVQKKTDISASPNPVALLEAQALAKEIKTLIGEPPEWLTDKIRAPGVHFAAIGGETSLFRLASELIDSKCISKMRILEAIENLCGKTDLELRLMEDVPAAMKQPQSVSLPTNTVSRSRSYSLCVPSCDVKYG